MSKIPIVVISAPSGTGKNTIISELIRRRNDLGYSISSTSRKPRPGEKNGTHYYFLTPQEFEKKIKENGFLEWAKYLDNYYGTSREEIARIRSQNKMPILDLDTQGALQLKEQGENVVTIFLLPPDEKTLEKRLRERGTDSEEEIQKRLRSARKEVAEKDKYDYQVVNDDLDRAINELNAILDRVKQKS